MRPDTDTYLTFNRRRRLSPALARLAQGADFVPGHNLIDLDPPHLSAANPNRRQLQLPAVDTLRLNPLAFPRNPCLVNNHHQDGSLGRGRRNDPELVARLAPEVFANRLRAFREADPDLLTAWRWLTGGNDGAGFDHLFAQPASGAATIKRGSVRGH